MEFRLVFAEIEEAGDVIPLLAAPRYKKAGITAYTARGALLLEPRDHEEAEVALEAVPELEEALDMRVEVVCPECEGSGEVVIGTSPVSPTDISPPLELTGSCEFCGGRGTLAR